MLGITGGYFAWLCDDVCLEVIGRLSASWHDYLASFRGTRKGSISQAHNPSAYDPHRSFVLGVRVQVWELALASTVSLPQYGAG